MGTCHHVSFLAWYGQSGRGYLPLALPPRSRWSCAEGRGVGVRAAAGGVGRWTGALWVCGARHAVVCGGLPGLRRAFLVILRPSSSSPPSARHASPRHVAAPRMPPPAALPSRSGVRARLPAPIPSASSAWPAPRAVAPLSPCISCPFCARLAAPSQPCPCTSTTSNCYTRKQLSESP